MHARFLRILVAVSFLTALSCSNEKDKSPDPATPYPYAVPGAQTMQMDTADLDQGTAVAPEGLCHALSALAVAWINANVAVRLAVPAAALDLCLHQGPIYLGDNTWRWTASGGAGASAWTAELTASVQSEQQINWSMRVSGTVLSLDRYLWFNGTCDGAARSGVWHFFDPAASTQGEVVRCTWELPLPVSVDRNLEFANVAFGSDEFGDLLRYEIADSIASVALEDASASTTSRVRWDLRDGAGRAVSAAGDTCCWGPRPGYPDTVCP